MKNMFCSFMSFPDETVNKISVVGELLPNCEARITAQDCVVETTKINVRTPRPRSQGGERVLAQSPGHKRHRRLAENRQHRKRQILYCP
ncbi:hypothetical protein DTO164E3_8402 [Paecilomyces variotii]|nr:hypothetical protein DTO032I3_8697 [Paecilomyces variotii]KAJ9192367.1 hypothetical protein DTO164E3_8402 [Paecilomyces variotii]KAJ9269148.1 hypothetical protein DTO212C5_4831 [Paecilomyces variotii]KAJ9274712.1 hypothetical protein DTO021D3_8442 [Paecilomyces variotii]KAJ9315203.1 hypothetical protein DTO271D3_4656 [Paecilomyces variotii]